jgi:hypothetical protein
MQVQPMPATSLMPEVARNPINSPFVPVQSVDPTLRERRTEGIKAMKEVQRTVIQGFVFEDETKDGSNYEGMETVNDTAESVETFEDMLKVFNYNKYRTQLMSNFTRMCQTKMGEKKKTKNWVEIANNRLEKVRTLSQLFVKQGYKVTHKITDGKYEIELDEVENPSLIGIAPDKRKVNIYYAPNDYKLPIFFQYDFDTKS